MPDEDLWQFNLMTGYRFAHQHAEISAGVLNLTVALETEVEMERGEK